jgi:hypothetical protein
MKIVALDMAALERLLPNHWNCPPPPNPDHYGSAASVERGARLDPTLKPRPVRFHGSAIEMAGQGAVRIGQSLEPTQTRKSSFELSAHCHESRLVV